MKINKQSVSTTPSNNIILFYVDLSKLRGGRFKELSRIVRTFSKSLQETISDQVQKRCHECGSSNLNRNGKEERKYGPAVQGYICAACGKKMCERTFSPFYRRHYPEAVIIAAIVLYYEMKFSCREIRRTIKLPVEQGWKKPTEETIYDWILTMICYFVIGAGIFHFPAIDREAHAADEMYTSLRGIRAYIAGIAAPKTKMKFIEFITKADKKELDRFLRDCRVRWLVIPEEYWTDGWQGYGEAVANSGSKHSVVMHNKEWKSSEGVHTNDAERFWETFHDWWDPARGYKRADRAWILVKGFEAYFNLLRPNLSLDELTPANAAGVTEEISWLSLIVSGYLLFPAYTKSVLQTLRNRIPRNELYPDSITLAKIKKKTFDRIRSLVLQFSAKRKPFAIWYRDRRGRITHRLIKVKKIYKSRSNGLTYISCHCYLRGEDRTFRMDRILDVPD